MKKLFREIKEGENKADYLKDIEKICRIRKDGRIVYGRNSNYFSHLVWNTHHLENPKLKYDGFHVHHKDTNIFNNYISNLEKIKSGEHSRLHMTGRKRVFSNEYKHKQSLAQTGKKLSEETKRKISLALKDKRKGSENPFYGKHHTKRTKEKISSIHKNNKYLIKYCIAEYQIFESLKKASEAFDLNLQLIFYRLKTHKPGYFYIENTNKIRRKSKCIKV